MEKLLWDFHLFLREQLGSRAFPALNYLWTAPPGEEIERVMRLLSAL